MSEKEKALNEFIESGALATNICPDFLRDAYFKHGFDSGIKAERERLTIIIANYTHCNDVDEWKLLTKNGYPDLYKNGYPDLYKSIFLNEVGEK